MRVRRVISLTSLLAFIILGLTGLVLYIVPQGRVAYWSGWTLLGLSKEQYAAIHTTFMLLFLTTSIWHIVLNWKPIKTYLKDKARRLRVFTGEFNIALGITAFFLGGTLLGLPPLQQALDLGDWAKGAWEKQLGSPPWGHAEENSLKRFTRGMVDWERIESGRSVELEADAVIAALRARGLEVRDEKQKLIEIARANQTTPKEIMAVIRSAAVPRDNTAATPKEGDAAVPQEGAASAPSFPMPMSGLGRMTLREYAQRYGVELEQVLARLRAQGTEVDPDTRLKEEAARLSTDPHSIIELLNAQD